MRERERGRKGHAERERERGGGMLREGQRKKGGRGGGFKVQSTVCHKLTHYVVTTVKLINPIRKLLFTN